VIKKISLLIIGLFLAFNNAWALSATWYMRNDTQTVNTVNGYILGDTQSSSSVEWHAIDMTGTVDINWDVSVLHSDGSETSIGSGVANYHNPTSNGEFSATWSCPTVNLVATDAIKVVGHIVTDGTNQTRTFVSSQLFWSKLNATTWTFYFCYAKQISGHPPNQNFGNYVYHGDPTKNTRIEGIDYNLAISGYVFEL